MIHNISINSYKEENNKIDKEENFNEIGNDFKLTLMVSYNNENHSFINDLLIKVKEIDEKYNLNKFDYLMRTSKETTKETTKENSRWNREFLKEKFLNSLKKDNKMFLCGPVGFMEYMKTEFLEADKVVNDNIIYV